MGIDLHIEELVLHGFAARDRHRIAAAVQTELVRLLGAEGPRSSLANSPALGRLNAGAFEVKAGAKPQQTGRQIAQAVFRSLRHHVRLTSTASSTRGVKGDPRP
jgi:hypothetical protein